MASSLDTRDKVAHDFITGLADILDSPLLNAGQVIRFTPSVKIGRRYLVVRTDDHEIMLEVNVEARYGKG